MNEWGGAWEGNQFNRLLIGVDKNGVSGTLVVSTIY